MKYSVVALHFTTACNLHCSFCYREKGDGTGDKPLTFFIDLVRYIKELAPQIALGGGEPFLFPGFINTLGDECKKHGVILNVTTNGTLLHYMDSASLHQAVKDVTMVSVSLDHEKWRNLGSYARVINRLKSAKPGLLVGTNLLLEPGYFEDNGRPLFTIIDWCINVARVDRVFLLHPKNIFLGADILKFKDLLMAISTVFPGKVFTDDLTRKIFDQGYSGWTTPCHYGRDIISIDEKGRVHGCSFETKKIIDLKNPVDILQMKDNNIVERFNCPFLKRS